MTEPLNLPALAKTQELEISDETAGLRKEGELVWRETEVRDELRRRRILRICRFAQSMVTVSCILLSSAITIYLLVMYPPGQERNSCITMLVYAILCSAIAGVIQPVFYWGLAIPPSRPLLILLFFPLISIGYVVAQMAGVSLLIMATPELLPISSTACIVGVVGLFIMLLIQFVCQVLVVNLSSTS